MQRFPVLVRSRGTTGRKQYNPNWKAEHVAFIVVAAIWFITLLMVGKEIDLEPHRRRIQPSISQSLALDSTMALMQPKGAAQKAPATHPLVNHSLTYPLEWYHQMHNRPALSIRNASINYPDIRWLPFDETIYLPPGDDEVGLDIVDGSYTNGSNPFMVVAYNGSFFGHQWPTHQLNCSVPCVMTSDVAKYQQRADVVVFHAAQLDWDEFWSTHKPEHQMWALHSMESEQSYSVQASNSPVMAKMDIQATYKLSPVIEGLAHIPVPYVNEGEYGGFLRKRPQMYNKTGLALWMHNNCEALSSRQKLVQQLMQLLPVDAPGKCLHNKDSDGMNTTAPTDLMAQYKFYLVFENVFDDPDWVSSTFFRALDAGTVPVVLGAPNVLKFAPAERSIIRACDFDSIQDLAEYLLYLDQNDTAYQEYLSWKEIGPSPTFKSIMHTSDVSPWCSMCVAAAQRRPWAYDERIQGLLVWHYKMKMAFDVLNARLDYESTVACRGKEPWWHIELTEDENLRLFDHNASTTITAEVLATVLRRTATA